MPLARYFLLVGGVLLALLFVADAYAPKSEVVSSTGTGIVLPVIRIHSDRKWPERVVFDTSVPAKIAIPVARTVADNRASAAVAEVSPKVRVRDAFAQLPFDPQKLEPKLPPKRKMASSRVVPRMAFAAQQPRSGFFANNIW